MEQDRLSARRDTAARQFNEHENRSDGNRVVDGLDRGFTLLADLLYSRLHKDVEDTEGLDSMLTPVSPTKTQSLALRGARVTSHGCHFSSPSGLLEDALQL